MTTTTWLVERSATGKVVGSLAVLGTAAAVAGLGTYGVHALRSPAVAATLVHGAPALVAGWLLLAIWRPREQEGEDQA